MICHIGVSTPICANRNIDADIIPSPMHREQLVAAGLRDQDAAAHRRRPGCRASSAGSCRPDSVGVAPFTICRYSGSDIIMPNMPMPMTKLIDVGQREHRRAEQPQRQQRLVAHAAARRRRTPTMPSTPIAYMASAVARTPSPTSRPCSATISSGTRPTRERDRAPVVDAVVDLGVRHVEELRDDDQRDDADRHVHQEHPAPAVDAGEGVQHRRRTRRRPGRARWTRPKTAMK